MLYDYHVTPAYPDKGYRATMTKTKNGRDYGNPVCIGTFRDRQEAQAACARHFGRARAAADRFGRPRPVTHYASNGAISC